MIFTTEERYGQLVLNNIMSSVWLGEWERYEGIFRNMNEELIEKFPFHSHYNQEEVKLWHENHFFIPGDYFVSPYFSSYIKKGQDEHEERKKDLLCLIGLYEKIGFLYPLEKEIYPDHFGCITAFLGSVFQESLELDAEKDEEYLSKLNELNQNVIRRYIFPVLQVLKENAEPKIKHPFFKEFLNFYIQIMKEEMNEAA